jgi:hypothetical protein
LLLSVSVTLGFASNGGRSWWAHFEFTRTNIKLSIQKKEIEDLRDFGGNCRLPALDASQIVSRSR